MKESRPTKTASLDTTSAQDLTPIDQLMHGSRVPALDGARGVACLMVLLHHCGRGHAMSGGAALFNRASAAGWMGVDLFFVLSGFLITGLLLDAQGQAGASLRFWRRRALRILPLAYAFLAIVFFSPLWRHEPWHPGVYAAQWWFWLYANNWLALYRPTLDHGVLGHFWSLAIEEQFYLLWPLVTSFLTRSRLKTLCLVVLGVSTVAHIAAAALHVGTNLICSLTPSRLDGLVLGTWLAVHMRRPGRAQTPSGRYRVLLATAGVLAVLLLWPAHGLSAGSSWVKAIGFLGLAVIFTLFLSGLLLSPGRAVVRRICQLPPLVYLGRISYGFYVLHMPIVMSLRTRWPPANGTLIDCLGFYAAALFAATILATVSWFGFERPLLRLRHD
jgi:peptidoglycan/LPS O-acetylase OafA/YrhL